MKKLVYMAVVSVIAAAGVFWSCQKDEVLNNPEKELMLKKAVKELSVDELNWNDPLCAGVEHEFCMSFPQAYKGNGDPKETTGQVQLLVEGDDPSTEAIETEYWIQIAHEGSNTGFCFNYIFDLPGTYSLRYKASNPNWTEVNVEVDNCGCEESFSYSTSDNLSVVFEYISDVDLENAEVKLTCPQIQGFTTNDDKTYTVNNEGNQTVLTWNGSITACEPITFDLTFTADCPEKGRSHANIWTDFKVNEISKKMLTVPEEYCVEKETYEGSGEFITVCEWPIIKYNCQQ